MEAFTRYILISTFCLSILYLAYLVFQKKETRLHQLRYFLIFSITLSLILPLSTYRIDLKIPDTKYEIEAINHNPVTSPIFNDETAVINPSNNSPIKETNWSLVNILFVIYFLGVSFFGLGLLVQFTRILYLFWSSNRVRHDNIVLLHCDTSSPFTFFNWIFIPNSLEKEESKEIITHERIHASQYHSIDLVLIELLAAVMWFNPLIWMFKNSVQLVHEYLADEGVLNTGTDKLRYQALLLNQIAEERLICLSSSFNHSLIKKRMIMMTKSKFNQGSKLKILALIPLATILFLGIACVNGQNTSILTTTNDPIYNNVLYLGVENPVKINFSTCDSSNLELSVIGGLVKERNGEFIIVPKNVDSATAIITCNEEVIQELIYQVKKVPNPVVMIAGKKNGKISKDELLKQKYIHAEIENFEYDVMFKVIEFNLVVFDNEGIAISEKSNSNKFTEIQKKIISDSGLGRKIFFENIKCVGPYGLVPELFKLEFIISE
ncbi:MAG: GldM family protein [Bacteroidales bacterium]